MQDLLSYGHKKLLGDDISTAEPPTGYGGPGAADAAAQQAVQQRQADPRAPLPREWCRRADHRRQRYWHDHRRRGRQGLQDVAGAVGSGVKAFADKTTGPDEYTPAAAAAIRPMMERMAAYARGDHAADPKTLDAAVAATAAANPGASPADIAVKTLTNEKIDIDQRLGLMGGAEPALHPTNARRREPWLTATSGRDAAGPGGAQPPAGRADLTFRQEGNNIIATVDPLGKSPPVSYAMNMQQFHDYLVGAGTSFDHVLGNGTEKSLQIASGNNRVMQTGYDGREYRPCRPRFRAPYRTRRAAAVAGGLGMRPAPVPAPEGCQNCWSGGPSARSEPPSAALPETSSMAVATCRRLLAR